MHSYDNQTLKIVIQDMEMTAKELRWKVMQVKNLKFMIYFLNYRIVFLHFHQLSSTILLFSSPILPRFNSCVGNNFCKSKSCFRKEERNFCAQCCARTLVFTAQTQSYGHTLQIVAPNVYVRAVNLFNTLLTSLFNSLLGFR